MSKLLPKFIIYEELGQGYFALTTKQKIKVTLIKSIIGRIGSHKACVKGLGLRRIGHSVVLEDSPSIQGMISKVKYLLSVEKMAQHTENRKSAVASSEESESLPPSGKPASAEWLGGLNWVDFFNSNNGQPGGADILCVGPADIGIRVGELAHVLLFLTNADREILYSHLVVVTPPGSALTKQGIKEVALHTTQKNVKNVSTEKVEIALDELIEIVHPDNLTSHSLAELIKFAARKSFIYAVDCSRYRNPSLDLAVTGKTLIEEDVWVPHLHLLAEDLSKAAKEIESCVLVDSGEYYPIRQLNKDRLMSADNCGVICAKEPSDLTDKIFRYFDEWINDIKGGQSESVLQKIDSLPSSLHRQKSLIKIQVLNRAGYIDHAIDIIRSALDNGEVFDAKDRVLLASISLQDRQLSARLMDNTIEDIVSQERLEQALRICGKLSLRKLEAECLKKLETNFPHSQALNDHEFSSLLIECKRLSNSDHKLVKNIESTHSEFRYFLLDNIKQNSNPDYDSIIDDINDSWPEYLEQAQLCCALHAAVNNNFSNSIQLAFPDRLGGDFSRHAANILLWSIESYLLNQSESLEALQSLESAVFKVILYMVENPSDEGVRGRLSKAMSPQVSGLKGLKILAKAMLSLANDGYTFIESHEPRIEKASEEDFEIFFNAATKYISSKKGVFIGAFVLPKDIIKPSADELLQYIIFTINRIQPEEENLEFLEILVVIGCSLSSYARSPDSDIDIIRMAANKMYFSGKVQKARDYAEHALTMTNNENHRSRLAWRAYSEIYHRGQNYIESLIGMVCVFSSPGAVTKEQAFYEIYCAIRILRDLGMTETAISFLDLCENIFRDLGLDKTRRYRLDTIRIGIQLRELESTDLSNKDTITKIAQDAYENLRVVLDNNDEIVPSASLVSQIIRLSKEHNPPVSG